MGTNRIRELVNRPIIAAVNNDKMIVAAVRIISFINFLESDSYTVISSPPFMAETNCDLIHVTPFDKHISEDASSESRIKISEA